MRCKIVVFLADRKAPCKGEKGPMQGREYQDRRRPVLRQRCAPPILPAIRTTKSRKIFVIKSAGNTFERDQIERVLMTVLYSSVCPGAFLALTLTFAGTPFAAQAADEAPVMLVPHRAVYELALSRARDAAQVASVRGRILYDFDGNACEGYTLKFRQVSELELQARARYRPATCARPPGKAATPSASSSPRRISSTRTSSTRSTGAPSTAPAPPPSISSSPTTRCSISTPRWCFRPNIWCG